jgi:hypothetical protein
MKHLLVALSSFRLARKFVTYSHEFEVLFADASSIYWRPAMKGKILVVAMLMAAASAAQAKDSHEYMKGVLTQMESSACGTAEKGSKTIAGEVLGTDDQHKTTQQVLCPEYVLQGEHTIYRIRPKDDKHPVLLPIGETAEFRIDKDKLILKVPEADGREREYTVVSMTARADNGDNKAVAAKTGNQ